MSELCAIDVTLGAAAAGFVVGVGLAVGVGEAVGLGDAVGDAKTVAGVRICGA